VRTETIASLPDHLLAEETVEFRKITAIIRALTLEAVEQRLITVGVRGVTVTRVKGCGEYGGQAAAGLLHTPRPGCLTSPR